MDKKLQNMQKSLDSKVAELVIEFAEKGFIEKALENLSLIKDSESKAYALIKLYTITEKEECLKEAIELVDIIDNLFERDNILLIMIESLPYTSDLSERLLSKVSGKFSRDVALKILVEKIESENEALKMASKIDDIRVRSLALRGYAVRNSSMKVAFRIPDPYYRAITILDLLKGVYKEDRSDKFLDSYSEELDEVLTSVNEIRNDYWKEKAEKKLNEFMSILD